MYRHKPIAIYFDEKLRVAYNLGESQTCNNYSFFSFFIFRSR